MTTMLPRPSASLYVGSLSPEVTEGNLFEIFNQVGPVVSIRVCRDNMTRRSLGYAYVNFHNVVDAERALDTLNYALIRGRSCRVMWSQRDPALRKSGVGNVFIKNLDKSIDNKTLHDTFSIFGNILSCRVMVDETGSSRGFGFIHFETDESAAQAISKANGMLLSEKKVFVGVHVSRRDRTPKYEELKKQFTNVFIKNLDTTITDEQLNEMFKEFGTIVSAIVMKDEQQASKGFGFVNFQTHEAAANACDELNEKDINGKKIFVGRAQKKAERKEELQRKYELLKQERLSKYQGVNLFVKNLDDTIDDSKLAAEFKAFGTITSSKVQRDERGISRGFGFVCFTSSEEATRAITEMNGKMLGAKPIYVALAQRREARRQQLEAQYAQRAQYRMSQQAGMYGMPPMFPQGMFYGMMPPRQPYGYPQMYPRRWQGPPGQPEMMMGGYPSGGRAPRTQGPVHRNPRSQSAPRPNPAPSGAPNMVSSNGQPRKGYRYTPNARNRVEQAPMSQSGMNAQMGNFNQEPLINSSMLASASPEVQKQMLGESLYPLICDREPELAPKITGMLLEMDIGELMHLLVSADDLYQKVEEAKKVLKEHDANNPGN